MLDSVKLMRRQSEIRQSLAALAGKDAPSDDEIRQMGELGVARHWRALNGPPERRMIEMMRAEVTSAAIAAALADERAQGAAAGNTLAAAQINALAARLSVLENAQQDHQMTTYNVSAAVGTSAAVVIAAGPIQSVKIQKLSDTERVYFAFRVTLPV